MNKTKPDPILTVTEFDSEDELLVQQLLTLRQPPGSALQQRVESIPQRRWRWPFLSAPSRLAWGGAALLVALLLFVSPSAQATLDELEQVVGQINLIVRSTKPVTPNTATVTSTPVASLELARQSVPFDFATPTYLPTGLRSPAEVSVIEAKRPLVKLLWRDGGGGFVQLTANGLDHKADAKTVVGPNSSQEILINGQPAVMVRGAWDDTSQTWHYQSEMTTIIWNVTGVQYQLLSYSTLVSLPDLQAMATSIR